MRERLLLVPVLGDEGVVEDDGFAVGPFGRLLNDFGVAGAVFLLLQFPAHGEGA